MIKPLRICRCLGMMLIICALFAAGCGGIKSDTKPSGMTVLRIGAIPAEDSEKMRSAYQPLVEHLAKKLGMKVELFVATDYSGVIEAMRSGKLDVALFGPFSYVLAVEKANVEAFAVEKRRDSGTTYRSIIITHPDSGINNLEDLKGRTFAFVDPASTSGNLFPRYFLQKNGIDPDKDFKSVIYSGNHTAVELAVKNRKIDAGADSSRTYSNLKSQGAISDQDVKIIYESDPIPASPWAWRKDLPEDLKTQIRDALLGLAQEAPDAMNKNDPTVEGYAPAKDSDYDIIRETTKVLNLDLNKMK